MGIKNRPGCCCGSVAAVDCLNLSQICRGRVPSLYLKDGKVTDDNGEWPLIQPTAALGVWQTALVPFATSRLKGVDCPLTTGKTYYRYTIDTQNSAFGFQSQVINARISYSRVATCDGGLAYSSVAAPNASVTNTVPDEKINCDPVSVDFTFKTTDGLPPPSSKARVEFVNDDRSFGRCQCRSCVPPGTQQLAFGYANGDLSLQYQIDDGEISKGGTIALDRIEPSDLTSGLNPTWEGDIDWWTGFSCSDPTNADGGRNVALRCSGLDFLKWCHDGTSGPRTVLASRKNGATTFSLIDDSATKTNQGAVVIRDASTFGDVCCGTYSIPRKDLTLTVVTQAPGSPLPPPVTRTYGLTYNETLHRPTEGCRAGIRVARWASGRVSIDDFLSRLIKGPTQPNHPGTWYFDCVVNGLFVATNLGFYSYASPSDTSITCQIFPVSLPIGPGSTEDPFHLAQDTQPLLKVYIDEAD